MARRLFRILSALSLVLCVATAVLWVRSYRKTDEVVFHRRGTWWRIASIQGELWLDNDPQRKMEHEELLLDLYEERVEISRDEFERRGKPPTHADLEAMFLRAGPLMSRQTSPIVYHSTSHALPLAASAILPAASLGIYTVRWWRRRLRRRGNCCPSCGYDLRATPGRCPECGTPAAGNEA